MGIDLYGFEVWMQAEPKETTYKLPTRLEPLPMGVGPSNTKQEPEAPSPKDQQTAD